MPITIPVSWVYRAVVSTRNRRYARGVGVHRIDRPVISVGNLTTGGTGKTPIVAWIAERLLSSGAKPVIAMRGYKSRAGQPSDEQAEYAQRIPGAHVVANPDRVRALREFLPMHADVSCVLLDDGFQHRQIERDLDLVLIDASARTFAGQLLPAGPLREPVESLRRADAVIVTHAESEISNHRISELKSQIEKYHGRPPIALTRHAWTHLDIYHQNARRSQSVEWLKGKRVATMLGIGQPRSVLRQLDAAGAEIVRSVPAQDHQHYDRDVLDRIEATMAFAARDATGSARKCGCDALVVTQKDWVKLEKVIDWSAFSLPIVVPRLAIEFIEGESELVALVLQQVRTPAAVEPVR